MSEANREIRQVVFVRPNVVEVHTRTLGPPRPHEIQVAATRTHISAGTELDYLNGTIPGRIRPEVSYPVYHGYAVVGRVVAVGSEVTNHAVGDRVLTMGPHASHHNAPAATAVPVPDDVPDEAATLAVLGSVALHGVRRAPLQVGDAALVVGDGIVGQLTAQLAVLGGGRPVALAGRHPLRLAVAEQTGIPAAWNERETDIVEAMKNLNQGRLADVVYETVGQVQAVDLSIRAAKMAGTVVLLGGVRQTLVLEPPTFYLQFMMRDLTLKAASQPARPDVETNYHRWTQTNHRALCLRLMALGDLKAGPLITHRFSSEDAPQAYHLLVTDKGSALGVVLEWASG